MHNEPLKIIAIIPSRFGSTRLPGKPLTLIAGKSLIQRVYEQVVQVKSFHKIIIATDHPSIFDHAQSFGAEVVMTDVRHPSGTDRCLEAIHTMGLSDSIDFVVNIQGDEPCIHPLQIEELLSSLRQTREIVTQITPITSESDLQNPNIVKVVCDDRQNALYFSRSPIPYIRSAEPGHWISHHLFFRHVGLYAYRSDILRKIGSLSPSSLELAESLEQLRWLQAGITIHCCRTNYNSPGIDTPDDVIKLNQILSKQE